MRFLTYTASFIISLICGAANAAETPDHGLIQISPDQIESYGIKTALLQSATEVTGVRYPAEVAVPYTQLQVISALQGGLVEALKVAEGDHVIEGQEIAKIQSPGLLELQRDLLQTLTQLYLAQSNLNRDKQLLDEGIIPKRRYQESRSAWQALVTQKQQQEATLKFSGMSLAAIADLEENRQLNSTLMVSAPFAGVLLEQMAIPGQKLEAADPLFKIGQLSPLWLEIHVPVDIASSVVTGDRVSVPELDIEGEIITIGRMVHAADQGTLLRAIVRNNTDRIRPGQVVQARLAITSGEQFRYLVPRKAIVRIDQQTMVFTETGQGFQALHVDLVGHHEGQPIIASTHPITEPVVISGSVTLKAILTGEGEGNSHGH